LANPFEIQFPVAPWNTHSSRFRQTASSSTRIIDATAQAICDYYKTDVTRAGNYVIKNMLSKSPHVHVSETPVETWGYQVNLACDNCGAEESHTLTKTVVDIATAINIARHEDCKPKPPAIIVHNPSTAIN
jgi:hypothetical protein